MASSPDPKDLFLTCWSAAVHGEEFTPGGLASGGTQRTRALEYWGRVWGDCLLISRHLQEVTTQLEESIVDNVRATTQLEEFKLEIPKVD